MPELPLNYTSKRNLLKKNVSHLTMLLPCPCLDQFQHVISSSAGYNDKFIQILPTFNHSFLRNYTNKNLGQMHGRAHGQPKKCLVKSPSGGSRKKIPQHNKATKLTAVFVVVLQLIEILFGQNINLTQ